MAAQKCRALIKAFYQPRRNFVQDATYKNIRQIARDFAVKEVEPIAASIDKNGSIPKSLLTKLHKSGLLSVCVPREYSGLGLDTLSLSIVVQEISRACGSTGSMVSIHNCLFANLLCRKGTPTQIHEHLVPIIQHQSTLGCFALSETDAGSDVAALRMSANRCGSNDWSLNGRKAWVTSALESDCGIFFATIDTKKFHKGITAFIVPMSAPGVIVEKVEQKMGIRGTSTCTVVLDDVKVPDCNVLGRPGEGFSIAMDQLVQARIGIASQALGIAQAALDAAVSFVRKEHRFEQMIKLKLAEMAIKLDGARSLTERAAKELDRTEVDKKVLSKYSSMAKVAASECANFNAHSCVQIMGQSGLDNGSKVATLYRDARITEIYGGVTDIQKFIVADLLLKGY